MVYLTPTDFQPLDNFPLTWRWTDARWNQLPTTALDHIRPLHPAKAAELFQHSLTFVQSDRLDPRIFTVISTIDDRGNTDPQTTQAWLKQHAVPNDERIVVSWSQDTAVVTHWGLFCAYWDDFCYPLADDVLVWPFSELWALFYHHEEILSFGVKR